MKRLLLLLSLCLVVSALTSPSLLAQDRERRGGGARGFGGGRGELDLKPGDPLPDVGGVDASGRPVNLRQLLDGQYAVIVFGCLT